MNELLSNRRGVSLIETLVVSAILGVIVMAVAYEQGEQRKQAKNMDLQLQNLQSVNQVISQVAESPDRFPFFKNAANVPVIYVACFNQDGSKRAAPAAAPIPGLSGFQGVFTSSVTSGAAATWLCADPQLPTIEVRLAPDETTQQVRTLTVFIPPTGAGKTSNAPAAKEIRSLLSTGLVPTPVTVAAATAPLNGNFAPSTGTGTCTDQRLSNTNVRSGNPTASPSPEPSWAPWYFCY